MQTQKTDFAAPNVPQLSEFRGEVIVPDDPGYDAARAVYHGGIDRRPAAILRPADAEDVAGVIWLARETGLDLAVRGGGHGGAGHGTCDGGLVLDLRSMRALEIDREQRVAWAQTGLTTGDYTRAAETYGMATGFGDAGSVGIGGITLGGGIGYLVRKHGLTIDDLLAAEIVTADGELLRASASTHPDLFWAIRGGGGNFGVATRLKLRLHELEEFTGGTLVLPATPGIIASFVAAAAEAPDELSTIANVMPAPPLPSLPRELHGRPVLLATMAFAGPADAAERALAPFRGLAVPLADMLQPRPYSELFATPEPARGPRAAMRTMFADWLDAAAGEAILEHLGRAPGRMGVAQIRVLGGAMARVPVDATAFAHRDRRVMVNVACIHDRPEEAPASEMWVARLSRELRGVGRGAYVNFLQDEGASRVREAYPGPTWDRLAEVKGRYDPTNLFRINHNVPPAPAAPARRAVATDAKRAYALSRG